MRIGFDAKRAFNNYTGLGNYSRWVISNLQSMYPEDEYVLYTPKSKQDLLDWQHTDGSEINFPAGINRLLHSYWRTFKITNLLKKEEIDIYHGLSNELPRGIQKTKTKSVVTIHDLIFKRFPEFYKTADRKIYDKKFRNACQKADKIIAVSQQTKDDIIHFYDIESSKIEVVYQDCREVFKKEIPKGLVDQIKQKHGFDKPYVLSVGTIEDRKNQLELVKGFFNSNFQGDLVLIGKKTSYAQKIEDYLNTLSLEAQSRVRFVPTLPPEDLPALFQGAHIFAYISKFEGFGIPIVEAQYSKVPVIVSNLSCLPETAGDGAIQVDPENIADIGDAIDRMENAEFREALISKGMANTRRFAPENTITRLHCIYQGLVS